MNKIATRIPRIMSKILCSIMISIMGGSLFAAGAMTPAECGMQCCCKANLMHMQSSTAESVRSATGCCMGIDARPCDIQPAKPYQISAMTMAPSRANVFGADLAAVIFPYENDSRNWRSAYSYSQDVDPIFKSPPLYLQKRSFLI